MFLYISVNKQSQEEYKQILDFQKLPYLLAFLEIDNRIKLSKMFF